MAVVYGSAEATFAGRSIAGGRHSWAVPAGRVRDSLHLRLRRLRELAWLARFAKGGVAVSAQPFLEVRGQRVVAACECSLVELALTECIRSRAPSVAPSLHAVTDASNESQNPFDSNAPRRRLERSEHLPPLSPKHCQSTLPPLVAAW